MFVTHQILLKLQLAKQIWKWSDHNCIRLHLTRQECGHCFHRRLIQLPRQVGGLRVDVHTMEAAHDPVGQVLDQFVAEFHFLSEGQLVPPLHH